MYRAILRTPGFLPVLLAALVGRLPLGAIGLVVILRTREMTGSYAAGGAVAAAGAIAAGVGSPLLGRIIDRRGQGLVLVLAAVWSTAAGLAFAALPDGTSVWIAGLVVGLAGLTTPPLTACQRAIWNAIVEPRLRHGAYALDSVIFELVYIAGPLLLVGGLGAWSLRAAAVACALLGGLGALAFAATRPSRAWRPEPRPAVGIWGPLRGPGVRTILAVLAIFGVAVAGVEIAVAAFADEHGSPHVVGMLLALWGVGSMAGGLVAGHLPPAPDAGARLVLLLGALAVAQLPLAMVGSIGAMAVAITAAGLFIAPSLAIAFQLLGEVAPPGSVTEAQSWVATAFGAGMAAGSALGGWIIEAAGTRPALALVAASGLVATAVAAVRVRTLRPAGPDGLRRLDLHRDPV